MIPTARQTNLVIFLGCTLLILIALYMQHIMGLIPCYLCVTQRVFVIATALIALLAFLHHRHTRFYGAITALSALAGGFFSGKQLWLQHLPEERVPACGPPVEYLFSNSAMRWACYCAVTATVPRCNGCFSASAFPVGLWFALSCWLRWVCGKWFAASEFAARTRRTDPVSGHW